MNPYQFKVTCSVCGGQGMGTIGTAAAGWTSAGLITHISPSICRDVIAARERKAHEVVDVPWIAGAAT